jgi:hypothetical protein
LDTTAKQKEQFERCRKEMMESFRGKLEVQKEYGMVLERNLKGLEEQLEKEIESNMQINMNNHHIIQKDFELFLEDFQKNRRIKVIKKYPNGDLYEGQFLNNMRDGSGRLTTKFGDIYEGEFKEDKKDGKGTLTYQNTNTYTGSWEQDKKSGHGVFVWQDGEKYTGMFKNDLRNGKGLYNWINGDW